MIRLNTSALCRSTTALLILLVSSVTLAQNAPTPAGNWEGGIDVGGNKLGVVFVITQREGANYETVMSVPSQSPKGIACNQTVVNGDSLLVSVKMIGGQFKGKLNAGRSSVAGTWFQGGSSLPLTLEKVEKLTEEKAAERSQTPKGPFPYVSEEVEYDNIAKTVHLGATLTKPAGAGPFPVAVLITGSGQQDRDETILGHKPFAVIADYLTRRGIAVLRVDDRGTGKSTGELLTATSLDFAQDVITSLDYLKTRPDVNPKKIGLIGHSEGGMIAPMVAAQRPIEVAFMVLLAGPGAKITDLMESQLLSLSKNNGLSDGDAALFRPLLKPLMLAATNTADKTTNRNAAVDAFKTWQQKTEPAAVVRATGVTDEKTREAYVDQQLNLFGKPWFRYFVQYDPAVNLKQVRCPVLALNGEKDYQVPSAMNLTAIGAALKGHNKRLTTKEMPGLSHLFQHCQTCTGAEYAQLTETFAPEALQLMGNWILTEGLR